MKSPTEGLLQVIGGWLTGASVSFGLLNLR